MAEHQDPEPDAEPASSDRPRRAQMSPRERRRRNRRSPRHATRGRRADAATDAAQPDAVQPDAVQPDVAAPDAAQPVDEPTAAVAPDHDGVDPDGSLGFEPVDDVVQAPPTGPRSTGGTLPPVRRSRRGAWLLVAALVIAAAVVVALLAGWLDRAIELVSPAENGAEIAAEDDAAVSSAVIVTYDADDPTGTAARIVVLSHDPTNGEGTVLLVPTATVADVPGYGAFSLGEAFTFGGAGLVEVSLANLLGVRFDVAVGMSDAAWRAVFDQVGPIEVEVRGQQTGTLPDGSEVTLTAGAQRLDAAAATDLLHVRLPVETELESMPRVQEVLRGLFDAVAAAPEAGDLGITEERLDLGTSSSGPPSGPADGEVADASDPDAEPDTPTAEPTPPERLRALVRGLAQAQADDAVTVVTLPVATLGTGREDSYRLDDPRAEALIADRFTALRPPDGPGVGASVQVLNGNGVPAIGQRVAERLSDGGYRIVLTDNADRFDYERTRIVVYEGGDDPLAIAQDVRERLGVGDIERSATPQSVVDVTIVVGRDFPG